MYANKTANSVDVEEDFPWNNSVRRSLNVPAAKSMSISNNAVTTQMIKAEIKTGKKRSFLGQRTLLPSLTTSFVYLIAPLVYLLIYFPYAMFVYCNEGSISSIQDVLWRLPSLK